MLTIVCCGNFLIVLYLYQQINQLKIYIMNMRDLLEKQIISDANQGDTTVLYSLLQMLPTKTIFNALGDEAQTQIFCYEIHVTGKNSFSTSIVSIGELDDSDVIMKAYELDKLEGDDCHHIDYIEQLSFEEWDTHFNFSK